MEKYKITCPKCNEEFSLDEALANQIKEELQQKLSKDNERKVEQLVNKGMKEREGEIKQEAQEDFKVERQTLENKQKDTQKRLDETQKNEIKLAEEKNRLEQDKKEYDLKLQRGIEEGKKKIQIDYNLKSAEEDKKITDLTKKIAELNQKAEQGSQEAQGTILEDFTEDGLRNIFPDDKIKRYGKGQKGGDILQKVNHFGRNCGSILIETKRTKKWQDKWISKLREDMVDTKAILGIIVSADLPKEIDTFNFKNNICICSLTYAIPVITLLREQVIAISTQINNNVNLADKSQVLHEFITSNDFKQNFELTVRSLVKMKDDFEREKRGTETRWKKREKDIDRVFKCITATWGGMRSCLGDSLSNIKYLECDEN